LVSTVTGTMRPGLDVIDLLKASFPGGSITGAPKIRAMEIIDELEGVKRGIYTGSIGWIGFDGDADQNIVIRTFVIQGHRAYFQVGGGIVADSDPEAEYRETLDKARGLVRALGLGDEDAENAAKESVVQG
ncbi:MAG: chorismate-binding protein, partial [Actinobacteria bacterium]|nr:chorismate-binding protein [Actinomycetota bacterium]